MDGVLMVALPATRGTVTYEDGDVAPLHQTMVWIGTTESIPQRAVYQLIQLTNDIAKKYFSVVSTVIGSGVLGIDSEKIVITQSRELTNIRDEFIENPYVIELMQHTEQHPTWIPHVSGWGEAKFGDVILFDRLGLWYGDVKYEVPFYTL